MAMTVDPDYFYTCRSIKSKSFGKVLPGFETVAQEVKKAIAKFKLRQVVISTMDNNTRIDLDKTKHVTPRSEPNFFSPTWVRNSIRFKFGIALVQIRRIKRETDGYFFSKSYYSIAQ